jgi:hypothetical protein
MSFLMQKYTFESSLIADKDIPDQVEESVIKNFSVFERNMAIAKGLLSTYAVQKASDNSLIEDFYHSNSLKRSIKAIMQRLPGQNLKIIKINSGKIIKVREIRY